MPEPHLEGVSPLTLNRLSVYLRCLRHLRDTGVKRISSGALAERFLLSASQIRKDLAQFGEFGIRGVGYEVANLIRRLEEMLGLDRLHPLVIVGMGNLGSALCRYLGFNSGAFRVVAGVDADPEKVGRQVDGFVVHHVDDLPRVVAESNAEIGILAVPAEAAQENYEALVAAGIKAVLNFAPARVKQVSGVPLKDVDLRINLEEVAFTLRQRDEGPS